MTKLKKNINLDIVKAVKYYEANLCDKPLIVNINGLSEDKKVKINYFSDKVIVVKNLKPFNIICNEIIIPKNKGHILLNLIKYNEYTLYLIKKSIDEKEIQVLKNGTSR